jgi:hypothetical protein
MRKHGYEHHPIHFVSQRHRRAQQSGSDPLRCPAQRNPACRVPRWSDLQRRPLWAGRCYGRAHLLLRHPIWPFGLDTVGPDRKHVCADVRRPSCLHRLAKSTCQLPGWPSDRIRCHHIYADPGTHAHLYLSRAHRSLFNEPGAMVPVVAGGLFRVRAGLRRTTAFNAVADSAGELPTKSGHECRRNDVYANADAANNLQLPSAHRLIRNDPRHMVGVGAAGVCRVLPEVRCAPSQLATANAWVSIGTKRGDHPAAPNHLQLPVTHWCLLNYAGHVDHDLEHVRTRLRAGAGTGGYDSGLPSWLFGNPNNHPRLDVCAGARVLERGLAGNDGNLHVHMPGGRGLLRKPRDGGAAISISLERWWRRDRSRG